MVDLTQKPFNLNEEQIQWVEETIAGMSEDEKIGQLFIVMNIRQDNEEHRHGGGRVIGRTVPQLEAG